MSGNVSQETGPQGTAVHTQRGIGVSPSAWKSHTAPPNAQVRPRCFSWGPRRDPRSSAPKPGPPSNQQSLRGLLPSAPGPRPFPTNPSGLMDPPVSGPGQPGLSPGCAHAPTIEPCWSRLQSFLSDKNPHGSLKAATCSTSALMLFFKVDLQCCVNFGCIAK